MRNHHFALLGLGLVLGLASCSSSDEGNESPGTGLNSVAIRKTTAAGDFHMSGQLGVDAGKLGLALAAIRDPDATVKPVDASKVAFEVTLDGHALSCAVNKVSTTTTAAVDLVFINDTTGSMSGTVDGIADSIESFTSAIAKEGVDARFSMYTYGDAFATKNAEDSEFTLGLGDFRPPSFDTTERPYIGLTGVNQFRAFLTELKGSDALGVGGGDGEENTLGALAYANDRLAFRDGAARMFVAIGDNPSHQSGDGVSQGYTPSWVPPLGDDLVKKLDGTAAVHVIGHDIPAGTTTSKFYNLKKLADGTGGAFINLPSDGKVDLGVINLQQWLVSSYSGTCNDATVGTVTIVIKATITGTKVYVGTLTFEAEIR